jgi:hypothetical protein
VTGAAAPTKKAGPVAIEGIDLTLRLLAEKKAAAERTGRTRPAATLLGMPATRRPASRWRQTPADTASESIAPGTSRK